MSLIIHHGDTEGTEKEKNPDKELSMSGRTSGKSGNCAAYGYPCLLRALCVSVVSPEFS